MTALFTLFDKGHASATGRKSPVSVRQRRFSGLRESSPARQGRFSAVCASPARRGRSGSSFLE
jgi:hypothetical protein